MRTYIDRTLLALGLDLLVAGFTGGAFAQAPPQKAPPAYVADPAVYKLLGENDQFLVIMAKRPAGHRDAWHSHLPNAVYNLTDCDSRIYTPDGKILEAKRKAGVVFLQPAVPSHAVENIGTAECDQLIVERK
jgi:hypothetical protein